jgi:hypothetical protein
MVENFWVTLSKKEYQIKELINLGSKIVDNYIILKKDYDEMMQQNKDFR